MKYALISDIHSSLGDLEKVLAQIGNFAPEAEITGLGDLFECTISKKRLDGTKYPELSDVMLKPPGFEELLTFPSIRGNQEERIVLVSGSDEPLLERIAVMPERMTIDGALLIHGHQWPYNGQPPADITGGVPLLFHGHTHRSAWSLGGVNQPVEFSRPIRLPETPAVVNAGSVIDHREWLLYDADSRTITFMKAD
ncbi:hypothetical protein NCCP2716_04890 [Sporosarcina sp. NCCP-2716]|uniref:metallophosphoesterase family protein n=1 Tax=Sporosarcina sp. NCCP-2716 TaxID=2943679 RepID=UPI0020415931|nr:metallophosphoesterase family protein [Sporosarcina sp. NCCP-2716]GKV67991.1 hypothetical protein NCCP2716_04890 [Sporosarcina sp. NCCP-2716]